MAADDLALLVNLRAGAVLFALAVADFVSAKKMDTACDLLWGTGRNRISHGVRNFFSADDCAMGIAIRQPRLAGGGRGIGLVRRKIARAARRLAHRGNLSVDVNAGCCVAKRRPHAAEICVGRTAGSRRVCAFGRANGDGIRWLHRAFPHSSGFGLCRANQLRPLHLPRPRGDAVPTLAANADEIPDYNAIVALDGAWNCDRRCGRAFVAAARTTDKPFSLENDPNDVRARASRRRRREW